MIPGVSNMALCYDGSPPRSRACAYPFSMTHSGLRYFFNFFLFSSFFQKWSAISCRGCTLKISDASVPSGCPACFYSWEREVLGSVLWGPLLNMVLSFCYCYCCCCYFSGGRLCAHSIERFSGRFLHRCAIKCTISCYRVSIIIIPIGTRVHFGSIWFSLVQC